MNETIIAAVTTGVKLFALAVFFIFFAIVVKPEVADRIMPKVIEASTLYAQSQRGVDLDPIFLSSGGVGGPQGSSLYSSKYGLSGGEIYGDLVTSDTRVVAMNRFLTDYDSPMAPYAETFVETADEEGLDWRLVVSISGVESAFGRLIPLDSYNAWGWKGGPGGDFSDFGGWGTGIEHVTTHIADGYGTDMDIFTMEPIYCPPCGLNPQHAWANGVTRYMDQLEEYRQNL